jgi:hypothetical protein
MYAAPAAISYPFSAPHDLIHPAGSPFRSVSSTFIAGRFCFPIPAIPRGDGDSGDYEDYEDFLNHPISDQYHQCQSAVSPFFPISDYPRKSAANSQVSISAILHVSVSRS